MHCLRCCLRCFRVFRLFCVVTSLDLQWYAHSLLGIIIVTVDMTLYKCLAFLSTSLEALSFVYSIPSYIVLGTYYMYLGVPHALRTPSYQTPRLFWILPRKFRWAHTAVQYVHLISQSFSSNILCFQVCCFVLCYCDIRTLFFIYVLSQDRISSTAVGTDTRMFD